MSDGSLAERINNNYHGEFAKKQAEKFKSFVKDEITGLVSDPIKKLISNLKPIKEINEIKSQLTKKATSNLKPMKNVKTQLTKKYIDPILDQMGQKVKDHTNFYDTNHDFTEHMKNIATHKKIQDKVLGKIMEKIKEQPQNLLLKLTKKNKDKLGDMSYKLVKKVGEVSGKNLTRQAKNISKFTKQIASGNYSKLKRIIGKKGGGVVEKSIKYIGKLRNKDYGRAAKTLGKITKEMVKGKYNTLTSKIVTKFPKVVSIGKAFKKSFLPPVLGYADNVKTMATGKSKFLSALAATDMTLDAAQVIPVTGTVLSTIGSAANFAGTVFYEAAPDHIKKKLDNGAGKIIDPVKNFFVPNRKVSKIKGLKRNENKMKSLPNKGYRKNGIQQKNNIHSLPKVSGNNVYKIYANNKITPKANKIPQAQTKIMGTRVDNSIKNQNKYTINISGTNKSTTEILNELVPRLKQSMANNYRYA